MRTRKTESVAAPDRCCLKESVEVLVGFSPLMNNSMRPLIGTSRGLMINIRLLIVLNRPLLIWVGELISTCYLRGLAISNGITPCRGRISMNFSVSWIARLTCRAHTWKVNPIPVIHFDMGCEVPLIENDKQMSNFTPYWSCGVRGSQGYSPLLMNKHHYEDNES